MAENEVFPPFGRMAPLAHGSSVSRELSAMFVRMAGLAFRRYFPELRRCTLPLSFMACNAGGVSVLSEKGETGPRVIVRREIPALCCVAFFTASPGHDRRKLPPVDIPVA